MRTHLRAPCATLLLVAGAQARQPVRVELDMDAARPGIQTNVTVPPGTTRVDDVAVYIHDPVGGRRVLRIGYLGALDRGISLGHVPTPGLTGQVTALTDLQPVTPVNPGNTGWVFPPMQPGFAGPEVQYMELNASTPAPIQTTPAQPIFTVDVELAGAGAGDVFRFYLLDLVTVWRGGQGGAFTEDGAYYLETGGDCVPDQTPSLYGIDPDPPAPVPPAAYLVDYVDGPGTITIESCYPDCDGGGTLNVNDCVCFQTRFSLGDPYADCDANGVRDINDFICFQTRFALGC